MKIAFICTGNTARSQIAEGFARYYARLLGKELEVYSAGARPETRVNQFAIRVMEEIGVDMSFARPKGLEEIPLKEMDLIITLCDSAKETCPYVPGARIEHWGLPDPASFIGDEEETLRVFRTIRDEIERRVKKLISEL